MPAAYQTDVGTFTDEELERLSDEIESEVNVYGEETCGLPYDDEASNRYFQMVAEIRRRWEEANPEEAQRQLHSCARAALEALAPSLLGANAMSRMFDKQLAGKIGDTIKVRKPPRFRC